MKKRGALFRFFVSAESRALAGWTGGLAGYNILNVWLFTIYGGETSIAQVYEKLPGMWRKAFGQYFLAVNSLEGWLSAQFFAFLPLFMGAYLAILAASLFVMDEETRAVVCLLTQPVRRSAIWAAKAAAAAACLLVLLAINLAASLAASAGFESAAVPVRTIVLSYSMSAIFLVFLGTMFAAVAVALRSQKAALTAGLGLLFLLFLLNMVFASLELPRWVQELNPFHYHDCSRLVRERSLPLGGIIYWTVGATIFAAAGLTGFCRKQRA